jgi:hypothetical protein
LGENELEPTVLNSEKRIEQIEKLAARVEAERVEKEAKKELKRKQREEKDREGEVKKGKRQKLLEDEAPLRELLCEKGFMKPGEKLTAAVLKQFRMQNPWKKKFKTKKAAISWLVELIKSGRQPAERWRSATDAAAAAEIPDASVEAKNATGEEEEPNVNSSEAAVAHSHDPSGAAAPRDQEMVGASSGDAEDSANAAVEHGSSELGGPPSALRGSKNDHNERGVSASSLQVRRSERERRVIRQRSFGNMVSSDAVDFIGDD